jgi:predicted methyltransferase
MNFFESVDEKLMIGTFTAEDDDGNEIEIELPAKFDVCSRCNGKGVHVNPSIDGNGLTQEDFDEDPDFEESYFRGDYDVCCHECDGKRVTIEPDFDAMNDEQKNLATRRNESLYYDMRERQYEERFGY